MGNCKSFPPGLRPPYLPLTCRSRAIFSSRATVILTPNCAGGREGERIECYFRYDTSHGPGGYYTLQFPGPAAEISPDPERPYTPTANPVNCATSMPSWQVLNLWAYAKTAEHPARLIFDIRNLADESRTHCWVDGPRDNSTTILRSNAKDCQTGRWSDINPDVDEEVDFAAATWQEKELAEVTFDTESKVLAVKQTWKCPGQGNVTRTVRGTVERKLDMVCVTYVPDSSGLRVVCRPAGMVGVNPSSGPVLLGPGKGEVIG